MNEVKYKPKGARVLVEDIIQSLSLEERGAKAGITVIVENENKPPCTMGKIVALGSDPLVHEEYKVNQIVHFDRWAGKEIVIEDKSYRSLEIQEIIGAYDE